MYFETLAGSASNDLLGWAFICLGGCFGVLSACLFLAVERARRLDQHQIHSRFVAGRGRGDDQFHRQTAQMWGAARQNALVEQPGQVISDEDLVVAFGPQLIQASV
jgi:hypothetical protein